MQTQLVPCTAATLQRAVALLREGQLVAFPTETVYGLGARADLPSAVRRIFEAKGRPKTVPLILHFGHSEQAQRFAHPWPQAARELAERFWPGPLTLVVKRGEQVLDEVAASGPTVALRVPSHPVAQQLLDSCEFPVAAPSANLYGHPPPRSGQAVLDSLDARIPLILDAGPVEPTGSFRPGPSTLVDVSREPAVLLRDGAVGRRAIESVIPLAP